MAKQPKKRTRKDKIGAEKRLNKELNEMVLPVPTKVGVTITRCVE